VSYEEGIRSDPCLVGDMQSGTGLYYSTDLLTYLLPTYILAVLDMAGSSEFGRQIAVDYLGSEGAKRPYPDYAEKQRDCTDMTQTKLKGSFKNGV